MVSNGCLVTASTKPAVIWNVSPVTMVMLTLKLHVDESDFTVHQESQERWGGGGQYMENINFKLKNVSIVEIMGCCKKIILIWKWLCSSVLNEDIWHLHRQWNSSSSSSDLWGCEDEEGAMDFVCVFHIHVTAEQHTLREGSRAAASSADRAPGFSWGLNTGLALTGGGSLLLGMLGPLSTTVPLPNSWPIRLFS